MPCTVYLYFHTSPSVIQFVQKLLDNTIFLSGKIDKDLQHISIDRLGVFRGEFARIVRFPQAKNSVYHAFTRIDPLL